MDFTVRSVSTDHIVVDFANGNWAQVPIQNNWDKSRILIEISKFVPFTNDMAFANVASVPMTEGETGTVGSYYDSEFDKETTRRAVQVGYDAFRARAYPSLGDQMDAMYKARQGDTTELDAIDDAIAKVKTDYPKDMDPITQGEFEDLMG